MAIFSISKCANPMNSTKFDKLMAHILNELYFD